MLLPPLFERMRTLCHQMDDRYLAVADAAGFSCRGCVDNCCRSVFYHHTLVEMLYLKAGFDALGDGARAAVRSRAAGWEAAAGAGERPICPLNEDGKCILYAHRPMICRLHGVAHLFARPDGGDVHRGPGCHVFEAGGSPDARLDRTDLYWSLSGLEQVVRAETGCRDRIRMTVARMITIFDP